MLPDWTVLVPFRATSEHRARLAEHVIGRWQRLGVAVSVADDGLEGPFSLARAVNRARAAASTRYLAVWGADHLPDPGALALAAPTVESFGWAGLFSQHAELTPEATEDHLDLAWDASLEHEALAPFCTGPVGVRADVWDEVGGFDPRFIGWGYEDAAFRFVLERLYGEPAWGPGRLYSLWHPHAPRTHVDANLALFEEYVAAWQLGETALRELIARTR